MYKSLMKLAQILPKLVPILGMIWILEMIQNGSDMVKLDQFVLLIESLGPRVHVSTRGFEEGRPLSE